MFRVACTLVSVWFSDISIAQEAGTPSAPPRKCEIRQAAWCIAQGAWEITDRLIKHDKYDHAWSVRGFYRPKAPLVVLEPSGCRDGFSDSLSAIQFDRRYAWEGKTWNRMIVRLRSDGSCDLEVLIPKYEDDPSAEAFFSGLPLVRHVLQYACFQVGCRISARVGTLAVNYL
jgi:hypothetical protein